MQESTMAHGLQMRWVPVVDERGETRLEAVWVTAGHVHDVSHAA